MKPLKKYSYLWITLVLFFGSLIGHWTFAWEQTAHNQPISAADYAIQTTRDTLENWQSEFLQLVWQVAGLAFLFFIGSPQSKEGDDRREAKLDVILSKLDPDHYRKILSDLEKRYPKG
jgi:hypothetical protein